MKNIKITILGDICPTADYQDFFDNNPNALFNDIKSITQNSDYTICNLECPATDYDKPIIKTGPNLKAKPIIIKTFKDYGINAVSLANNHVLDYGKQGFIDTLDTLDKYDIKQFGGGKDSDIAAMPLIIEIDDKKIAFMSFAEHEFNLATKTTAGANWFDPYKSLNQIANVKTDCDYVIVLYHGGIEHYKYPSPLLQKKCRAIVDAGADAVFCQHSHCIGTIECYADKPIVYGQGNTVFGYRANSSAWNEGFVFNLIFNEDRVDIEKILLSADEKGIKIADKAISKSRIEQFNEDSQLLSDDEKISSMWNDFCVKSEALVLPNVYGKSRLFNKFNRMLNNKLVNIFIKKKKLRVTLAYIRCEAHHEVVKTILENKINEK